MPWALQCCLCVSSPHLTSSVPPLALCFLCKFHKTLTHENCHMLSTILSWAREMLGYCPVQALGVEAIPSCLTGLVSAHAETSGTLRCSWLLPLALELLLHSPQNTALLPDSLLLSPNQSSLPPTSSLYLFLSSLQSLLWRFRERGLSKPVSLNSTQAYTTY